MLWHKGTELVFCGRDSGSGDGELNLHWSCPKVILLGRQQSRVQQLLHNLWQAKSFSKWFVFCKMFAFGGNKSACLVFSCDLCCLWYEWLSEWDTKVICHFYASVMVLSLLEYFVPVANGFRWITWGVEREMQRKLIGLPILRGRGYGCLSFMPTVSILPAWILLFHLIWLQNGSALVAGLADLRIFFQAAGRAAQHILTVLLKSCT